MKVERGFRGTKTVVRQGGQRYQKDCEGKGVRGTRKVEKHCGSVFFFLSTCTVTPS
jgi:hypothetical protein